MLRTVTLALALILLMALPTSQAIAKSSVWKISKGEDLIFLGGTIHLLASTDHPLPPEFEQAYAQAGTLFFETDLRASGSAKAQMLMMEALSYQDARTLKSTIAPETYGKLSAFLASRGLPMERFEKFTPAGISLTLAMLEYQRLGMQAQFGVDAYYTARAQQDNKNIEGLETIETQISFIRHMADGQEDEVIIHSLRDIDRAETMINDLKDAWRRGDIKRCETYLIEEFKQDFPEVYRRLILNRNDAWMDRLEELFDDQEIEFVLVGSLHLIGQGGLLTQLQKRGYRIQQL